MFRQAGYAFVLLVLLCGYVKADDGYRLWLRYDPLPARPAEMYRGRVKSIAVQGRSATFDLIRAEFRQSCASLLGTQLGVGERDDASVVVGMPQTSS